MLKKVACLFVLLMSVSFSIITGEQYLPFIIDEIWRCDQGNNSSPSHYGRLAYAWDFNQGSGWDDFKKPCIATASGSIVYRGWKSGWGYCVVQKFGDFQYGLYAHLQEIFVHTGEYVDRSQIIGLIGNSGTSSPHLHYQRQKGADPNSWSIPSSFNDAGVPIEGGYYTSQNRLLLDWAFNRYGSNKLGYYEGGGVNPNHPWYESWDRFNLRDVNRGNVATNCVINHYNGGDFWDSALVYDAINGAREARVLHSGFWVNWTNQGGPNSSLGMPITDEYDQTHFGGPAEARQDFQLGYLYYKDGQGISQHQYPYGNCPGMFETGWMPEFSYLFADEYNRQGARNVVGEPWSMNGVTAAAHFWQGIPVQDFYNPETGHWSLLMFCPETGDVYRIKEPFWSCYRGQSGMDGWMGYVTCDEFSVGSNPNHLQQNFHHGYIEVIDDIAEVHEWGGRIHSVSFVDRSDVISD
ncbi:MAG: M23 family metallopeptidase [bacterium]